MRVSKSLPVITKQVSHDTRQYSSVVLFYQWNYKQKVGKRTKIPSPLPVYHKANKDNERKQTNRCKPFFHSPFYRFLQKKPNPTRISIKRQIPFLSLLTWLTEVMQVCFAYGWLCIAGGNCSYRAGGIILCGKKINKFLIHKHKRGDEQNIQLIKINGFCTHEGSLLKSQWKKCPCWAKRTK